MVIIIVNFFRELNRSFMVFRKYRLYFRFKLSIHYKTATIGIIFIIYLLRKSNIKIFETKFFLRNSPFESNFRKNREMHDSMQRFLMPNDFEKKIKSAVLENRYNRINCLFIYYNVLFQQLKI